MKAKIQVLKPGLFSSIQDLGRFGFQKYGVPCSGVMDRYAMRICNLILGNNENSSVLEITMQGPHLKFENVTVIALSGADLSAQLNGNEIPQNQKIKVMAGDELKFGKPITGGRAYLGIQGGFISEKVMNSQSWYEGLTENYRLKKGMDIYYHAELTTVSRTYSNLKITSKYLADLDVEAYPGPEFYKLEAAQQKDIYSSNFTVNENSNRMAIQFNENLVNQLKPIITAPVLPGTVQLTPSGKIIALMRDCQTTGGYPRILQLSEKGFQVLAQKLPGEKIRFVRKEYPSFTSNLE